jgi:hypothetical protein
MDRRAGGPRHTAGQNCPHSASHGAACGVDRNGRYVTGAACERLLQEALRHSLRMVVSGHTHQFLDVVEDGGRHLSMPSSGFILPDHMQARVGEKLIGIGVLDFWDDGTDFDLWCPNGMMRHDVSSLQVFQTENAGRGVSGTV